MSPASAPTTDLAALRRGCAPLIAWYERFLAEGRVELTELDDALAGLRGLPAMTGRLGRALALLVSGGADASTEETLAALELLRTTASLRAATPPEPPPPPAAGRRARRRGRQPPLPGIT